MRRPRALRSRPPARTSRAASRAELTKSFSSAADTASRYPASIQDQIIAGAKTAFLQGDQWAYTAGIVAVLLGAALVCFKFPRRDEESRLLADYQSTRTSADGGSDCPALAVTRPESDALPPQRRVVPLVLVGVRLGKRGHGAVEDSPLPRYAAIAILSPERACALRASSRRSCRRPPAGGIHQLDVAEPLASHSWRM